MVEHTLGKGEVTSSILVTGFGFQRSEGNPVRAAAFAEQMSLELFGFDWVRNKGPIKDLHVPGGVGLGGFASAEPTVEETIFTRNTSLSETHKAHLRSRGAIFEDAPGDRTPFSITAGR